MNHRVLRVRELLRRELAMILEKNYTFPGCLVTIHDVDVTPDFRQCFIFTGILGKSGNAENIIKKLNDSRSAISRELFKRVILKNSPSLLFKLDDSVERGVRILRAIEDLPEAIPDEETVEDGDSHDLDEDEDEKSTKS